jgi:hypothetical protein
VSVIPIATFCHFSPRVQRIARVRKPKLALHLREVLRRERVLGTDRYMVDGLTVDGRCAARACHFRYSAFEDMRASRGLGLRTAGEANGDAVNWYHRGIILRHTGRT